MRRMIADKLRIIWEDAHLIAVDKPCNMLSVPGREYRVTHETLPRSEQWGLAIGKCLEEMDSTHPLRELAVLLESRSDRVPRSETKFIKFLHHQRRDTFTDASIKQIWDMIVLVDKRINGFDLSILPEHLISAADLVEGHCGHRIFHIHRLDQETSGLLAFAKNDRSAGRLSEQFRNRETSKIYVAKVRGQLLDEQGRIELPISPHETERVKQRVDLTGGKPSCTLYQRLPSTQSEEMDSDQRALIEHCKRIFGPVTSSCSLVQLQPITGRTHQLRVHMAALGHPIIGDTIYDPLYSPEDGNLCLHAARLVVKHPVHDTVLELNSYKVDNHS